METTCVAEAVMTGDRPPPPRPGPCSSAPQPLSWFWVSQPRGPARKELRESVLDDNFLAAGAPRGVEIKAANGRPSQRLAAAGPEWLLLRRAGAFSVRLRPRPAPPPRPWEVGAAPRGWGTRRPAARGWGQLWGPCQPRSPLTALGVLEGLAVEVLWAESTEWNLHSGPQTPS